MRWTSTHSRPVTWRVKPSWRPTKIWCEAAEAAWAWLAPGWIYKTVRAPISGQVSDLSVKLGDVVKERDPFTSIVRNDRLYTQITIPVTMAERTKPGLPVWLLDPTNGTELAQGELKFVDPDVKVATQGLLAKAEFNNPGNRLRSGMRVRTLVGFGSSQQLAVPFDAVIRSAGQSFVYVIGPARELNAKQRQHFSSSRTTRRSRSSALSASGPCRTVAIRCCQALSLVIS